MEKGISLSELARQLGRAKSGLHKLAAKGQIPQRDDGKFDLDAVRSALASNTEETARMSAAFVSARTNLPLWAIRKACENWAAGRVPDTNPAFPPNAVQIKLEADRIAAPRRHELGRIETALKAEVIPSTSDEERDRALSHWRDTIRPTMHQADVTESLDEKRRDEQLEANRRLLAREIGPDGLEMTRDMRRKLGIPIKAPNAPSRKRRTSDVD
jgi:hypothetical protein